MNKYIKTKQQYKQLVRQWVQGCERIQSLSPIFLGSYHSGVTPAHHLLYNFLRDKPLDIGFSNIINKNKLRNGKCVNQGILDAISHIRRLKHLSPARQIEFLQPFKGILTMDDVYDIERQIKVECILPSMEVYHD